MSFVLRDGSVGRAGINFGTNKAQMSAPFTASVIVATVVVILFGKTPLLSALYAPIALRIAIISLRRFALFARLNCPAGLTTTRTIEKRTDNIPITTRSSMIVKPLLPFFLRQC